MRRVRFNLECSKSDPFTMIADTVHEASRGEYIGVQSVSANTLTEKRSHTATGSGTQHSEDITASALIQAEARLPNRRPQRQRRQQQRQSASEQRPAPAIETKLSF